MASLRNVSGNGHHCPRAAKTGGAPGCLISDLHLAIGLHEQCAEVRTAEIWRYGSAADSGL